MGLGVGYLRRINVSNYFAERAFKILINLVEYKVCWKAPLEVSEFFVAFGGRSERRVLFGDVRFGPPPFISELYTERRDSLYNQKSIYQLIIIL